MSKTESLSNLILAIPLPPGSFSVTVFDEESDTASGEVLFSESVPQNLRDSALAIVASFNYSNAAQLQRNKVAARGFAKTIMDVSDDPLARLAVAAELVDLDEHNRHRKWMMDLKAATASATTLAQFKTAVAALPDRPELSVLDVKNAIKAKLDSGDADSDS